MKKVWTYFVLALLLLSPQIASADNNGIAVNVNGVPLQFDVPPQTINDRTMVPMRKIFESLGATVYWNDETQMVTGIKGNIAVNVTVGSNVLLKNSVPIVMDTAPVVIDDRTLVPVRAIAESFNCLVDWDESTQTVNITAAEQQNAEITAPQKLSAEQIADKCSPAVFYIEVYDNGGNATASGSGFFIDSDGTAVTNYHVIDGTSSAYISTTDGKIYAIDSIVKYDKDLDLAVISISKSDSDGVTRSSFPFLEMTNSNNIKAGQTVYAIGSPKGLQNTISNGIISNTRQVVDGQTYIQTTAAISHGSSGGALVNEYGEVIGVTSAGIDTGENLGFAIPINSINSINKDNEAISYNDFAKLSQSLDLEVSTSEVRLQAGDFETVYVYAGSSASNEWSIYYEIGDTSIAYCQWGEWLDEYPDICPLYIYGEAAGETNIKIYSDINSEEQYIKVNVSKRNVEYYPNTLIPTYTYFSGNLLKQTSDSLYIYAYDETIFDYIDWLETLGYIPVKMTEEAYGTSYTFTNQTNYLGITFATQYREIWIYASRM